VDLDIDNGVIAFEKMTAVLPLLKRIEMSLGLDPKYLAELRPCVMFSSSPGAEVTILNETELQLEIDGQEVYPVTN
jgi:hypothetical protein